MMPAVEAPLPSVEHVERIVRLVKSIIFPDYFNKRQSDESIRAYYIGNYMVELQRLLIKQIAHGLQFCEDCTDLHNRETVYACAEETAPLAELHLEKNGSACSILTSRQCSITIPLLPTTARLSSATLSSTQ